MRAPYPYISFLLSVFLLWGCGTQSAYRGNDFARGPLPARSHEPRREIVKKAPASAPRLTHRVLTEEEILRVGEKDWDLSPSVSRRILARINVKDPDYIEADIQAGRMLKVPTDFSAFKNWTPLERNIPALADVPKLILVVKDIPFVGWYERGRLVGDSYTCIGKEDDWTRAGIYTVKEKDIDHISRSYKNAYGQQAPMPYALRIYETVWIHAGDITGGYCSHGCINLPMDPATRLFAWADPGTVVLVVDAHGDLRPILEKNRSNCVLYASNCVRAEARLN